MSQYLVLNKFIGESKTILDDLYKEPDESNAVLGLQEYLALPKTEAYIKRELAKKQKENDDKYDSYIEEKYDHIINKISISNFSKI